jgi:Na+-transporting methylmalonyl-CoA/oxaloacetate decarboxylase beta subunit
MSIIEALGSLFVGFGTFEWTNGVMILVGCVLLYLGIKKGMEPLLLIPIGFGAILVNIPHGRIDGKGWTSSLFL